MAADTPVPEILSLDSLVDRPVVVIDGTEYELYTPFSIPKLSMHKVGRLANREEALMKQEVLTAEEEAELDAIPTRICALVLDAPVSVQETLSPKQRQRVVERFFVQIQEGVKALTWKARLSTGANGSPDSSGSTAVIPLAG